MSTEDTQSQELFKKLKTICVPLLENSQLTPKSVPTVLQLLSSLVNILSSSGATLSASLVSYVFFPISTILRRNASAAIPDQVLERLLKVLGLLCESWWWDCELAIWDQIFMLCGSIIGGIDGKGKGKDRDDETKQAAAQCLWALLRERDSAESPSGVPDNLASTRLSDLQQHAQTNQLIPVLGQTLNYLLQTATSPHLPLQRTSLQVLRVSIGVYASSQFVPSILPGVVSSMTRIALGVGGTKGWANGGIVVQALAVMEQVIVRSIGDDVCIRDGAVRNVVDLEDFAPLAEAQEPANSRPAELPPYFTARTPTWLRALSSQLHIALNTLTPLVTHPTSSALLALCTFSKTVLAATPLTLPQSQSLLLSWLLSLSNSPHHDISKSAHNALLELLTAPSTARQSLLETLLHVSKECLSALPRSVASQADAKVEHIAGQIVSICRLAVSTSEKPKSIGLSSISSGIDLLLGPTGGIEKWGWTLLSVLEFRSPSVSINRASFAQSLLEDDPDTSERVSFPEVTLKNVLARSAHHALARMFRALGRAGRDNCLYSVEWFVSTARNARTSTGVAGLWCAARLLEGTSGLCLDNEEDEEGSVLRQSKKLERFSRGLARGVAELWDEEHDLDARSASAAKDHRDDDVSLRTEIEITKGFKPIRATLQIAEPRASPVPDSDAQPLLHRTFSLHLLSITAGILQARYTTLLIHVLYPILHSLISPISHLSLTALATLDFITHATSYASPANLLLSHFDYALDAVSRRLTRRWLDVDATKVLVVLVRLVGSEVVQKAGDVVEECFDRLDEYHGYEVIVEGLVEVLGEVIKVIEADEPHAHIENDTGELQRQTQTLDSLFEWVAKRKETPIDEDTTDYGPAPQRPWGDSHDLPAGEQNREAAYSTDPDPNAEPPHTPAQALTKQMVSRSIYFLTHGSAIIRARILALLSSATPVLPESALLPSIHHAWPFILNRLNDNEPFVVSAAAALIESLVTHVGSFMSRRIWDDIWPRFCTILGKLDIADSQNALARRGYGAVGTESAYTHSHRLYRSLLRTMTAAVNGVHMQDSSAWQVILAFRRFLHSQAHEELQGYARQLYTALAKRNEDAVWLALVSTSGKLEGEVVFLREQRWDIDQNVQIILGT
ncbi:hypothetical protein BV22DRAFT_1061328 [Leucogyrophana mollusca]|uniref:Uncharacterized protein n=1 Tax=Leucogyrophana mollusca TaxID=85980 RepID=A0ACB8BMY1_9AGAM|nr:hypothetical protein BV22DRAFT_1061328 [Leucogyrophana mollusca]